MTVENKLLIYFLIIYSKTSRSKIIENSALNLILQNGDFHFKYWRTIGEACLRSQVRRSVSLGESEVSQNIGEHHQCLHPSKRLSRTSSLTNTKRHNSLIKPQLSIISYESLWSELFWIIPVLFVHMNRIIVAVEKGCCWYMVS